MMELTTTPTNSVTKSSARGAKRDEKALDIRDLRVQQEAVEVGEGAEGTRCDAKRFEYPGIGRATPCRCPDHTTMIVTLHVRHVHSDVYVPREQ